MNPSDSQPPSTPMPGQPAATDPTAQPMQPLTPVQASDQPAVPISDAPLAPAPAADPQSLNAPQEAHDNDLIEKEWVVKAKDIVNHTQNNPYEQARQLAALKADYMRKRYNKLVKLNS